MKIYLVSCHVLCGNNGRFLVRANNKKEAINKIWEEYYIPENAQITKEGYDPYYKKELYAQRIDNVLNDNGGSVRIW